MTTTNTTFNISFFEAQADAVSAAYFQMEGGWITFKSAEHKPVAAYPETVISGIKASAE